ncbi:MAG: MazG nucleotide pyrophosphohydrolase domain-containing protein [Candidatus Muiribacteriota bacterium]|jgi:NTP pyrophosphatase (non-canonical NTP hydrolase)
MEKLQNHIEKIFGDKDRNRDIYKTLCWLTEEVGELNRAIRKQDRKEEEEEFADVLAFLISAANVRNINLEEVFYKKYPEYCIRCNKKKCECK